MRTRGLFADIGRDDVSGEFDVILGLFWHDSVFRRRCAGIAMLRNQPDVYCRLASCIELRTPWFFDFAWTDAGSSFTRLTATPGRLQGSLSRTPSGRGTFINTTT